MLQNKLWEVLVRVRSFPVALTGDIKKAFLQIRIREEERDALRFHWKKNNEKPLQTLRFTRALFGLVSSPFLLGGVIEAHLDYWEKIAPEAVAALRKSLYVDDILTGGETASVADQRRTEAEQILGDATFTLHKWSSNAHEVENSNTLNDGEEQTDAKQHLRVEPGESRMLGLPWNKDLDTLSVTTEPRAGSVSKRSMLSRLAKIYDPIRIASPLLLTGKLMYREVCDQRLPWDAEVTGDLRKRWEKWEESLPLQVSVPRAVAPLHEKVEKIELHAFGDASVQGLCAVVYTVTRQPSGVTQELLASKARLAKRGLTIPRLELVSGHMVANLVENACRALSHVQLEKHCWLDSTVALWWIKGEGDYKQFVANRVAKIQDVKEVTWHYVPTKENPADLGSRGGQLNTLWLKGPSWLQDRTLWPLNPVIKPNKETQVEAKVRREVLTTAVQTDQPGPHLELLEKYPLKKVLRVSAWIKRFVDNSRTPAEKRLGPLTTEELEQQYLSWIHRVQKEAAKNHKFDTERGTLNLQPNSDGILECHGRIQGRYPIYLPDNALFTKKLVEKAHSQTIHGGVGLTMAKIREKYWVPRLRQLVKKVRKECHWCKRFTARGYQAPTPGFLPKTRTEPSNPFQNIGVDFAGPIRYKIKKKQEGKAHLVLYSCSLTRGVYLEVIRSLETPEFLQSLKRFIARRGRPQVIYSDNGATFKAADKWLKLVREDERFHDTLNEYDIKWRFNLSRAPWWGGQYERLIGIFKSAFNKVVGKALLTFEELTEVVLDVEICMNKRPLSYVEDDVELPVLTPNSFLFQQPQVVPELEPHQMNDKDLRKRLKFLRATKDALWSRWTREYVTALRERHKATGNKKCPSEGEIVIIRGEKKTRNSWKMGKVIKLLTGKDGVVRGVQLELSCDPKATVQPMNPEVPEFRPRRAAAKLAQQKINKIIVNDNELNER